MTIHDYYLSINHDKSDNGNGDYCSINIGKEKRKMFEKTEIAFDKFFIPKSNDLKFLPNKSILIEIAFTLKKPYMSKAEGEFHVYEEMDEKDKTTKYKILYNAIVRDTLTKKPIVKPSTWKGHLRYAAKSIDFKNKKMLIKRLFGSQPDEDPLKGRLYFFTTFFNNKNTKNDVITPINRSKRIPASGPIAIEVVEANSKGVFYLLYLPYPVSESPEEKSLEDLEFIVSSLEAMFFTYGFSAKKTSGFGTIKEKFNGKLWLLLNKKIQEKTFSDFSGFNEKIKGLKCDE